MCVCVFYSQGTNRYFQRVAPNLGLDVSFADCTKPEQLKAALKPNTKVSQREGTHADMQPVSFTYVWHMVVQHICTQLCWFFCLKLGGGGARMLLIKCV